MPIPRLASSPLAVSRSPLTIRPGRALHRLALLLSAALAALLTVLAVTPAAWAETNSPLVALYGAAGTFGGLRDAQRTPSGETFAARAVDDWAFLPGQAAYFSAAAPDGTVFIANEPQTDSQYRPTATTMAVSAFNPVTERIRHLVVPTTTGRTTTATGADVADVEVVRAGTTSRVAFMSAVPYQGSGDLGAQGLYPTLGYLSATSAGWSYDGVRSLTADALPAAASACVQRYNALWQPWRDCLAPAEMAQLPASGLIAVTQYIAEPGSGRRSGALLLLDVDGRLRGRYLFPNVTLPDGTPLAVHPREVDVDPTGIVGAERVAVVFDTVIGEGMPNSRLGSFAVQELTVDSERGVIAPRSAAVATGQTLGGRALSPETAQYDASGRLWVAQAVPGTLDAGPLVTYDAGALAACQDRAWATACPPDATVSGDGGLRHRPQSHARATQRHDARRDHGGCAAGRAPRRGRRPGRRDGDQPRARRARRPDHPLDRAAQGRGRRQPQRAVAPDPTATRPGRLHRGPVLARPVAHEDRPREAARPTASDDARRRRGARRRLVRGGHRRADGPDASDSVDAGAVRPGARRARWRQHPRGDRRRELRPAAEHVSSSVDADEPSRPTLSGALAQTHHTVPRQELAQDGDLHDEA